MNKFKQFLTEMPAITAPLDLHTKMTESRIKALLSNKYKTLKDSDGYILFVSGNRTQGQVILHNKYTNKVEYEMEYIVDQLSRVRNAVMQYYLYSDPRGEFNKGVAREVVFEFLLKDYDYLITDLDQTTDGKRYWENLMRTAISRGKDVGTVRVGGDNHDINWYKSGSFDLWLHDEDGWSKSKGFEKRFIIAK